jgi:hypothetical protein
MKFIIIIIIIIIIISSSSSSSGGSSSSSSSSIQVPPKICIHTLTKENSMLYVSTKFNCTSQVTIEHNTSFLYLYS